MSEIKGKEYSLAKIFSSEFDYEMPRFQRPYSWTEEQTGELFDDLFNFWKDNQDNDDQYFLGSIVLVKSENDPHSFVIDGQQRLATLTILFAVLAENAPSGLDFEKYINEPGDELEGITTKPRMTIRSNDNNFFHEYVQNIKISELVKLDPKSADTEAQGNIILNAKLLYKKVTVHLSQPEDIKEFGQFLVKRCCIVAVSTPTVESAFKIFSVLNSRGLDLMPTDILKADIIGKIEGETEQEEYTRKWENLEKDFGREEFNEIFSAIRMIFMQAKSRGSLSEDFTNIFKRNKSLKTPEVFIDNVLIPYSKAYDFVKNNTSNNEFLHWLNRIDNFDWIPPAIFYYIKHKDNPKALNQFFRKLERLAAFMSSCSYDVNKRINRYSKVLRAIERIADPDIPEVNLAELEKINFIEALNSDIYLMVPKRRKYLILRLDSFISAGGAEYNPKVFTIEHVLPQEISAVNDWLKLWPDDKIREKWLHKIGNLIPLERRTNSKASNFDFDKKKSAYFFKNGASSYVLTNELRDLDEWTPKIVEARQQRLIKIYRDKWELN